MKQKKDRFRVPSWFGLLGLLGFLGFLPPGPSGQHPYLFFAFFGFFGWFFWHALQKEEADERMVENQKKAASVMANCFCLLSVLLLLALDKQIDPQHILLFGSLAYGLCFILSPALIWYFDRVAD